MEQQQQPDFTEFSWKGQRRFRCNRTWESGARCEYDHYDQNEVIRHVAGSHGRMAHIDDKKQQQAAQAPRPASRILDPTGAPVNSDPAIQRAQFKP